MSRNGDIDRFDGRRWRTVYESGLPFSDVWDLGNGELWMSVGGPAGVVGVAHYERGALETFPEGVTGARAIWATVAVENTEAISDIWGRGPSDVYAVGSSSSSHEPLLLRYDGSDWKRVTTPPRIGTALWGCGDRDLFMADPLGVAHFDLSTDDGDGTPRITDAELNTTELTGVWAASPDHIVVAGRGGQILRRSR